MSVRRIPTKFSLLGACLVFLPGPAPLANAAGIEYRSVGESGTVMYDAPSANTRKLFVASKYFPVEVVVALEGWIKVRDNSGDLAWVEKKALIERRYVVVTAPVADVRQGPNANAPLVFQAQQNVALEFLEAPGPGWVKVRHRDGQTGFVRTGQVWGA